MVMKKFIYNRRNWLIKYFGHLHLSFRSCLGRFVSAR